MKLTTGVPHCYSGWHAGHPKRTGGLSDEMFFVNKKHQ